MSLITIDTGNEKLYEPRSFEPAPRGTYIFSITDPKGNLPLRTEKSEKNSEMVSVALHVEANADGSETDQRGKIVYDWAVIKDPEGKADKRGEEKLAHLAQCFGVMNQEGIRKAGGVDIDLFTPEVRGKVDITIKEEEYQGEKRPKNNVSRYLWE